MTPNGVAMKIPTRGPWLVSLMIAMDPRNTNVKKIPPTIDAPPTIAMLFLARCPEVSCQLNQLDNSASVSEIVAFNQTGKLLVIVSIVLIKNSTSKNEKNEASILINESIAIFFIKWSFNNEAL